MVSKTLYLLRHAKSSWKDPLLADALRPLNKRGRKNAPLMGWRLAALGVKPQRIIASPALRAVTTARVVGSILGIESDTIEVDEALYCYSTQGLRDVVERLDDKWYCVLLVGHNPAITGLVNALVAADIENVPTCGIVGLEFTAQTWAGINEGRGRLTLFEYPKK
ncbi:MAG: histidine phosphatase family protein [Exilibacterium sp.]